MGKASSSKKVARVARTGGGRTARGARNWLWPVLMGAIIVAGVIGVAFSRNQGRANVTHPTLGEHWHAAYGFDICGNFLPDLPQPSNLIGIHTHGDGVLHIEPQVSADTGKSATLGRFVSGYPGLKLSATSLGLDPKTWKNGDKCEGKPAVIQAKVNGRTVSGDPRKIKIPKNGWVTVAFLPKDQAFGPPPNYREKVAAANSGQAPGHQSTPSLPTEGTVPTPAPTAAPPASGTPTSGP
jgi:hypothetical protein